METIVDALQDSIGSIDFWINADKQKKVRSDIKTALMLTGIDKLKQNRERVAIEIMKLAKNRHDDLLKGAAMMIASQGERHGSGITFLLQFPNI